MPALSKSLPKYRKHGASGQAVVTIAGVDHYLGPHRSATSRRDYDRLVAGWLARGRQPAPSAATGPTVVEVLAACWRFAESYYPTPRGKLTGELWSPRGALRFVRELYADRPAEDFGPLALKVVRERMVDAGFALSPAESESRRRDELHAQRKTPGSCGSRPGTNRRRKPARSAGDKYETTSYARAIARGCRATWPAPEGIEGAALRARNTERPWSPNQLRPVAATAIRREFGLEAAQIALGHAGADVTQVYAERDLAKGAEVARRIG